MQKVASIIRYRGDRDQAILWMSKLPKVPKPYEVKVIFDGLRKSNYLIWTEDGGIRIVK
jgi:hypothetical protein